MSKGPGAIAALCAAVLLGFGLPGAAVAAGFPAVYTPLVVKPDGLPERAEFDLVPALERARREGKRLYVYLGADTCRFCRKYEAFLDANGSALAPHFAKDYLVVDLRGSLSVPADAVFLKVGGKRQSYAEFQAAIGDERARALVYPNIWLLDASARPLMQMPSGAGTFQTVPEQLEILRLEQ